MSDRLLFSCLKNEGPFILEWLAYHRALGFDKFLLFSNDCDDGTDTLLDALDGAGIITHARNDIGDSRGPQWSALNSKVLRKALKSVAWAIHLDADEFLVVKTGDGRLQDLFDTLDATDAISIPWRFFGNAGVDGFEDQPITRQFTRASDYPMLFPRQALMYKTLFRPGPKFKKPGIHAPKPRVPTKEINWRNGNGVAMSAKFDPKRSVVFGPDTGVSLAQVNHYALRSRMSFLTKSDRGLPNRSKIPIDLTYWVMRNFNDTDDHSASRIADSMVHELDTLRALPDVERCHATCCTLHREKAQELLQTETGANLYAATAVAGSSRAPTITEISRIYHALGSVYGKGKA